jgi:hypothetical protein
MVAKKPQDHQRKKPTVKEVDGGKSVTFPDILARTADGKTIEKDGNTLPLTVTVDTVALDDFELLDDMRGMDDGNHARMPAMLRRLVGDDYKAVLEAFRDRETGRVPITKVAPWVQELLGALNPNS